MAFHDLLDQVIGEREIVHEVECVVCGYFETYYCHPKTKKTIGRACESCGDVQQFTNNQVYEATA